MSLSVLDLTQQLIQFPSVSQRSNAAISDFIQALLEEAQFKVERLTYEDEKGEQKVNLIAKLGAGTGGLAFCSHSDVVPADEAAFVPTVEDGRLYGRGSCDMKGPLAATLVAASSFSTHSLRHPLYIIVTADEEIGLFGAKFVVEHSKLLQESQPRFGIIAEPTQLTPIYAHKGGFQVIATSHGIAAHSSTDKGRSANFALARFMAEMADLRDLVMKEARFQNELFDPPTNGFNMTMTDFDTAGNVTAPKARCKVGFRTMPNAGVEELGQIMVASAEKYGLDVKVRHHEPLFVSTDSPLVKTAVAATNRPPQTVSYGTDGIYLQQTIKEMVVLGPGDIAVAHTDEEYIEVAALETAVSIYKTMAQTLCAD